MHVNPTTSGINLLEIFLTSGTVVEQSPLIHIVILKPSPESRHAYWSFWYLITLRAMDTTLSKQSVTIHNVNKKRNCDV